MQLTSFLRSCRKHHSKNRRKRRSDHRQLQGLEPRVLLTAPFSADDSYSTQPNMGLLVEEDEGLLENDFDLDGHHIDAVLVSPPAYGSLSLSADGSFSYFPNPGFSGVDQFTYHAVDFLETGNTATATLTVGSGGGGGGGGNSAPVGNADAYSLSSGLSFVGAGSGVLANDHDADGDSFTAELLSTPSLGSLSLSSDGSFSFDSLGQTGTTSFSYRPYDGTDYGSSTTVTLTVSGGGGGAVVEDDSFFVEAQSSDVELDVLSNDPVSGVLSLGEDPEFGSAEIDFGMNAGGDVVLYSPTGQLNDQFTYINTSISGTGEADVSVNVHQVDNTIGLARFVDTTTTSQFGGMIGDGPQAWSDVDLFSLNLIAGDELTVDVDALLDDSGGTISGLESRLRLFNFSGVELASVAGGVDPDTGVSGNDPVLNYTAASAGTYYVGVSGEENDEYNPSISGGSFSFSFGAYLVEFEVAASNDAPASVDDSATVHHLTHVDINVLGNDTDPDGDVLDVSSVSVPTNGSAQIVTTAQGTEVRYTPAAGFTGTDSFTYTAADPTGADSVSTVTVTVTNSGPAGTADEYAAVKDTVLTTGSVLDNDLDADGDPLTAVVSTGPANGTLVLQADGSFTYTPDPGYSGQDSFAYTASDGADSSPATTVTLNIFEAATIASDDQYVVGHDSVLSVLDANGVLNNDWDFELDPLSAVLAASPSSGTLTLNALGGFVYTPNAGFVGSDSFTYWATDGTSQSEPATVSIQVTNYAPLAGMDNFQLNHDTALNVLPGVIFQNDVDIENASLTATLVTSPTSGTLTFATDGSFTYVPNAAFTGSDSFSYTVSDGLHNSNVATVTLAVTNFGPTAGDDQLYLPGVDLTFTVADLTANDVDPEGDSLQFAVTSQPSNGTLTDHLDGTFTYLPNVGFSGIDTFTYTVTDSLGETSQAEIAMKVSNSHSVAVDDFFSVSHGTPLVVATGGLLTNDIDSDGDQLQAALVTGPQSGSLTFNSDGTFSYVPDHGYVGADSFTYVTNDGFADSTTTATVTINVSNEAPVARPSVYSLHHGMSLNVTAVDGVLSTDTDPDADSLTAVLESTTTNGTLTLNANGDFSYAPNVGFTGTDTFRYAASDGVTTSPSVEVEIIVTNTAPITLADQFSVTHDSSLAIDVASGVLSNDVDGDSDTLTVSVVSDVAHGTLSLQADGSFVYTPNAGYAGSDSFTYAVTDGASTSESSVSLNVVNSEPNASDRRFAVLHGRSISVNSPGLLAYSSDADSDVLTVSLVDAPVSGTVTINADGTFDYVPDAGFVGEDSFTYSISDGITTSDLASVVLSIRNSSPNASNDAYHITHDTPLSVPAASGLLSNDSDLDADNLLVALVAGEGPASGSLILNSDGTFNYTPNAGFTGEDSFRYTVSDGAESATASVEIVVTNTTPESTPDVYGVQPDTILTVGAVEGLLQNDLDAEADTLTASLLDGPANGAIVLQPDGSFVYTPTAGFVGVDRFTYKVADSLGAESVPTTVHISTSLVASNDRFETAHGRTATGNVRGNDFQATTDPVNATLLSTVSDGSLTFDSSGNFTFTPSANFTGAVEFTYSLDNSSSQSNPATVRIDVVNDAPKAHDSTWRVSHGRQLITPVESGLGGRSSDANNDALSYSIVTPPQFGSAVIAADGTFTYEAFDASFVGTDSFDWSVSDGLAPPVVATATIDVTNKAAIARSDAYFVHVGATLSPAVEGSLLANDNDAESDTLSVELVSGPAHGTLTLDSDGTFQFVPDAAYPNQSQTFTYRVYDGVAFSEPATVSISVTNQAPVATGESYRAPHGRTLTVSAADGLYANDLDIDGDATTTTVVQSPSNGSISINPDGSFDYQPDPGFTGTDTVQYRLSDGYEDSSIAIVTFDITNDAPDAIGDVVITRRGVPVTFSAADLLANDTDVDEDLISIASVSAPSNGSLVDNADGTWTYTPNAGYAGIDSFSYVASDGVSSSSETVVSLEVLNAAPEAADDRFELSHGSTLNLGAGTITANDYDPENDTVSVTLNSDVSHGVLSLGTDGSLVYTPNSGFEGRDSFSYTLHDGDLGSQSAVVVLDVVNNRPVVHDSRERVNHSTALTVDAASGVLSSAIDLDDDVLQATLVSDGSYGTVSLASDGSWTYVPQAGFVGTDSFVYRVTDGAKESAAATMFIDVQNAPVVASPDAYVIDPGESLTVASPGILLNDSDIDGDSLVISLLEDVDHGVLTLQLDGSFTFTPNAGFVGTDTFTYRVFDGVEYADATVDVTVTGVDPNPPEAPAVRDEFYKLNHSSTLSVASWEGVLGNDRDFQGDNLTVQVLTGPSDGSLTLNSDGSFDYTPNPADGGTPAFTGSDSFTYTVSDGTNTVVGTSHIDVHNSAPVISNSAFSVQQGQSISPEIGLLGGLASDADGDAISFELVGTTGNGTLGFNSDGTFSYTPNAGFSGSDSFSYRVSDGVGYSQSATVTLDVNNERPAAYQLEFSTQHGTVLSETGSGVLSSSFDADGDSLTASLAVGPSSGAAIVNPDGTFTYTPNPGFSGVDEFRFVVNDGAADSHESRVVIYVNNESPVVQPATALASHGGSTSVQLSASDADGDGLTFELVSAPTHGSLTFDQLVNDGSNGLPITFTGSPRWTPAPGFVGDDSFQYRATDGASFSEPATVSLSATNFLPVAADTRQLATRETDLVVEGVGLFAHASDSDGDDLQIEIVAGPSHGTVTLTSESGANTGGYTYSPDAGYAGIDSFTWRVFDGAEWSDPATVEISVDNNAPTLAPTVVRAKHIDGANVGSTRTYSFQLLDTLAADPDGDDLAFELVAQPTNGTATISPDGALAFTSASQTFVGSDTVQVRVTDGYAFSEVAEVRVEITNTAPAAFADAAQTVRNGTFTFTAADLIGNDVDLDGDALQVVSVSVGSHGTLTESGGTYTFQPGDFIGSTEISYQVSDGLSLSAPVTLNVTVQNSPVWALDKSFNVSENSTTTFAFSTEDGSLFNPDNDDVSFNIIEAPQNGSLAGGLEPSGYVPNSGFIGHDSFTFTVSDGASVSAPVTYSFLVKDVVSSAPSGSPLPGEWTAFLDSTSPGTLSESYDLTIIGSKRIRIRPDGVSELTLPLSGATVHSAIVDGVTTILNGASGTVDFGSGTATIESDGRVTFNGSGTGGTRSQLLLNLLQDGRTETVQFNVDVNNTAPVVGDIVIAGDTGDVSRFATDHDGDTITYSTSHPGVNVLPNGQVTFTPSVAQSESWAEQVVMTATDQFGLATNFVATFAMTVYQSYADPSIGAPSPTPTTPLAAGDTMSFLANGATMGNVLTNDTKLGPGPWTAQLESSGVGSFGVLSLDSSGLAEFVLHGYHEHLLLPLHVEPTLFYYSIINALGEKTYGSISVEATGLAASETVSYGGNSVTYTGAGAKIAFDTDSGDVMLQVEDGSSGDHNVQHTGSGRLHWKGSTSGYLGLYSGGSIVSSIENSGLLGVGAEEILQPVMANDGSIASEGGLHSVQATGNLDSVWAVTSAGPISTSGDIYSLSIGFESSNPVQTTGQVFGTPVNVGGDLWWTHVEGTYEGNISVGGNVGALEVTNDLAGSVEAGGHIGNSESIGYGTQTTILGQLSGTLEAGGDIYRVDVSGISGSIQAGEDVGLIEAESIAGTINAEGSVHTVTSEQQITGEITAGQNVGSVTTPQAFSGAVNAGNDLGVLSAYSIDGLISAENGTIRSITATDGAITSSAITAGLSIGSVKASGGAIVTGGIQSKGGYIGEVSAMYAIEGAITAADNVGTVTAGTSIRSDIKSERGAIGTVSAASGAIDGNVDAEKNIESVSANLSIDGDISAGGSIERIATTYSSISGKITAGSNIGSILAGTHLEVEVDADGNINTIESGANASMGGDITGQIEAGAGIASVKANGVVYGSVGVGVLDAALLAAAILADAPIPRPSPTFTAVGGNIEAHILAQTSIGGVSADGTIKGNISSAGSIGGVVALKDIDATIASVSGITSVQSTGGGIDGAITAGGGAVASAYGDVAASIESTGGAVSASTWGALSGSLNGELGVGASAWGNVTSGELISKGGSVSASSGASIKSHIDAANSAAAMARQQVDVGAGLKAHNGDAILVGIQAVAGFITAHDNAMATTFGSLNGQLISDTESIQVVARDSTADLEAKGGGIFISTLNEISGKLEAGNGDVVLESESVVPSQIDAPAGTVQVMAFTEFDSKINAQGTINVQAFGSTTGSLTSEQGDVNLTTLDGGDISLITNGGGNISVVSWAELSGTLHSTAGSVSVFALGDLQSSVSAGNTASVYAWGDTAGTISGDGGVDIVARNNVTKEVTSKAGSIEIVAIGDLSAKTTALAGHVSAYLLGEVSKEISAGTGITVDASNAEADLTTTSGAISVVVLDSYNGALRSGGDVSVSAGGTIQAAGGVQAGGDVSLRSIGSLTGATITAGGSAVASSSNSVSGLIVKKAVGVTVSGLTGVNGLNITNDGSTVVYSGAGITGTAKSGGDVTLLAVDDITGTYTSTSSNASATAYGTIAGTFKAAAGDVSVLANQQLAATLTAGSAATALSLGSVTVTISGVNANVTAGGAATVTTGQVQNITVSARDAISGQVTGTGTANVTSVADQISANVTGYRSATVSAISGGVVGNTQSPRGNSSVLAGMDVSGEVSAGNKATVRAVGSATGTVDGKGGALVTAYGAVSGQVTSDFGAVNVSAGADVSGQVTGLKDVSVNSVAGSVSSTIQSVAASATVGGMTGISGGVTAAVDVTVYSFGEISGALTATTGDVSASTLGGGVTGAIDAGSDAGVTAFGAVTGTIDAGKSASLTSFSDANTTVHAGESIAVSTLGETKGSFTAGGSVYISSFGNATPGNVTATSGNAVVSSAQDVTTLIDAGGSASVRAGGSANVIATASQDAFVMSMGQALVALTAGHTAFGWSAGQLAGTIEGIAGNAGAMALGTFSGEVTAGEDAFVFSFGMMTAQVTAGGSAAGVGMSLTAGNFAAGSDVYVFSLESSQPMSLTAGGSAGLVSMGGSNAIVEGVDSAFAWTAGDFNGTLTSTAGSSNLVAFGRVGGANVTAATEAAVLTAGSFDGTVSAGGSAIITTMLGNGGTASAGDSVFLISGGNISGSASAGDSVYALALGDLTAAFSADQNISAYTYADFSGSLTAGNDVLDVYAVGDLSGTIHADNNVGSGGLSGTYEPIFAHGSILAHIQAGTTGGGGTVGAIGAWGEVAGSITATEAILGIRSAAAVTATLNAPAIGQITEYDTLLISSTPIPDTPSSNRDQLLAELATAIAAIRAEREARSEDIEDMKADLASARSEFANKIADLRSELAAEAEVVKNEAAIETADAQAAIRIAQQLAVAEFDFVFDELVATAAAVREYWRYSDSNARSYAESLVNAWAAQIESTKQSLTAFDSNLADQVELIRTNAEQHRQERRDQWQQIEADLKELIAESQGQLSLSDIGHTALGFLGMIDIYGIGTVADLINAAWYAAEGNWEEAAWSFASAVPGLGRGFVALKYGCKAAKTSKTLFWAQKGLNYAENSRAIEEGIENGSPLQVGLGVLGAIVNTRSLGRASKAFGECFFAGTLVHEIVQDGGLQVLQPPAVQAPPKIWEHLTLFSGIAALVLLEAERRRRRKATVPARQLDVLFSSSFAPLPDQPSVTE